MNEHTLLKHPVTYRLPWSRFQRSDDWMRAEIVATKFTSEVATSWAIREGGCVLTKEMEWEIEPIPSSRDDAFFQRARYDSPEEAAEQARRYFTLYLQQP